MKAPLFAYIGGKSKLADTIVSLIPEHRTYCEVFAGAGWVFFTKEPSRAEVINDLDGELIALYRVLQNHLEEFCRQFKWLLSSRELFEDYGRQLKAGGLTDIQKAARYYYAQRLAFGGRVRSRTFGVAPDRAPRINLVRMEEELSQIHLRLAGVTIENLTWQDCLKRYDRSETLYYLDPPYWSAPCYTHNFSGLDDYRTLAEALLGIKGRFLLSINDRQEIREIFGRFRLRPVSLGYTVNRNAGTTGRELLVANYKIT